MTIIQGYRYRDGDILRFMSTCAIFIVLIVLLSPGIATEVTENTLSSALSFKEPKVTLPLPTSLPRERTKRSPFIVAFQVTKPPGMFQFSMKRPVIMGVMSNMTSMLLGSELARMFSRGITNSGLLLPLNVTNTTNKLSQKTIF